MLVIKKKTFFFHSYYKVDGISNYFYPGEKYNTTEIEEKIYKKFNDEGRVVMTDMSNFFLV